MSLPDTRSHVPVAPSKAQISATSLFHHLSQKRKCQNVITFQRIPPLVRKVRKQWFATTYHQRDEVSATTIVIMSRITWTISRCHHSACKDSHYSSESGKNDKKRVNTVAVLSNTDAVLSNTDVVLTSIVTVLTLHRISPLFSNY